MAVELSFPSRRVFAFNPYPLTITGLVAGQAVSFTFNGITVTRYSDTSGNLYFPLSGAFQSCFYNVEIGDVIFPLSGYVNSASKYVSKALNVYVNYGTGNTNLTFDVLYGALQIGETELSEVKVYQYGNLPLSITNHIGSKFTSDTEDFNAENVFGREILLSNFTTEQVGYVRIKNDLNVPLKTYNIVKSNCTKGIYLRWVSLNDGYKYDLLTIGQDDLTDKLGTTFNNYPTSMSASANGLLKGFTEVKDHTVQHTLSCGISSADEDRINHISTILGAKNVWMYLDSKWVEVTKGDLTITKKRTDGNRDVTLKLLPPKFYTQNA